MDGIGVVGVGRMGLPLAEGWAQSGHDIVVYDRDPNRRTAASAVGLRVADDLGDLVDRSSVLVTVLPGAAEIATVLTEAFPRLRSGALWLDLSSADPQASDRFSADAWKLGLHVVAAPMGGNPTLARDGGLTFYMAGDVEAVAVAGGLLRGRGRVVSVGSVPAHAYVVKLLANLLWFGQAVAVTEAMLVGAKSGLNVNLLAAVLAESAGGSVFIDKHLPALLEGDYLADFGIDGCAEELVSVVALADRTGSPFTLSREVSSLYQQALERFGPVPGELLAARLLEERAGGTLQGLTVRPSEIGSHPESL